MLILPVILSVALTLAVFYILGLRKAYLAINADQARTIQQTIESERRAARAETELTYMKLTLNNVLQRPAMAVLNEEHMHQLAGLIESILKPERMN